MANFYSKILWLTGQLWVAAFLLPFAYLLGDTTYFNKDDNFTQFTPVFSYAFDAILKGEFPWMHPGELNIRLAESPYYAVFSPILLLASTIAHLFHLEPYWIINFWCVAFFTLINLVLLRFVNTLPIDKSMKSAILICAGIGSYMGQYSINWYYVLPALLLLIAKIDYWSFYLHHHKTNTTNDCILLVATFLATCGGNPQFFLYAQLVEFIFLAPFFNKQLLLVYFRNQAIGLALLAPWIYCQIEYWSGSWRTIFNWNKIEIDKFLISGLFNVRQQEGQSIWIVTCLLYICVAFIKRLKEQKIDKFCLSLCLTSALLLIFSSLDLATIFGEHEYFLKNFTTPRKWWFFGGVTSVLAISLWCSSWTRRGQIAFAAFALITSGLYLIHNYGQAAYPWKDTNYVQTPSSIEAIQKYADPNSRVFQLTNFRNLEPNPSGHLLLNTWLTSKGHNLIFTKGYETIHAKENLHPEIEKYFDKQDLSLAQYQSLGVSVIWVNKQEFSPALFDSGDYKIAYEDEDHFLVKLKKPGQIVTCTKSPCDSHVRFYPDHIEVDIEHFQAGDLASIKVTPYTNFSLTGNGKKIPYFVCGEDWLCFKLISNINNYQLKYQDLPFIALLVGSNLLFILILFMLLWAPNRARPMIFHKTHRN
ncbi:hypothetical protein DCO17_01615 [Polynucleobacter tropicus]|uniref:Uncharacterized protein n=1 Tax=Polynucleobacter tropicus TaxID=1743174 RepID=A0A6M9PTR5_9BURK|nr:hypothetical protein [Polynucleobacter tropicus]QKM64039.1 hypothetical protein DCO17_01615 [Polynucleobacter tropicus]